MRVVVCGGSPLPVSAVDLGIVNVLWAFPHRAYSNPHWRSQGRQAFRALLKASLVQLPEATPPGVPPCLPGHQHPGLVKGSGVVQSSRPRSRVSWCSEKLLPPLSFTLQDGIQSKQLERGKKEGGEGGLDAAILGFSS